MTDFEFKIDSGASKHFKRPRTAFLKRHMLASDTHEFVGRIYDLSIVSMHFDTYEELAQHADCRYVMEVDWSVKTLTGRVESLNMVGNMLWPEPMPRAKGFPLSRYQWLTASADVFLMRFISVVDCSLRLTNAVFEMGLPSPECKLRKLKQLGVASSVVSILGEMLDAQSRLRTERNALMHQGYEREFTLDDQTFRIAAMFEQGRSLQGNDQHGRRINVDRSFREGLVGLQREFNASTRELVRQLDSLYGALGVEFESRFVPRIRAATHGLNANSKRHLE